MHCLPHTRYGRQNHHIAGGNREVRRVPDVRSFDGIPTPVRRVGGKTMTMLDPEKLKRLPPLFLRYVMYAVLASYMNGEPIAIRSKQGEGCRWF